MTATLAYATTGNFDVVVADERSTATVITPRGDDFVLNLDQLRDLAAAMRQAEGFLADRED